MEITDDQTKLTGDTLAVDFETYYEGKYSLKFMDPHSYCLDPRFDAYIMSVYDGKYCWVGHPKDLTGRNYEGQTLVAFNASFDYAVYLFALHAPGPRASHVLPVSGHPSRSGSVPVPLPTISPSMALLTRLSQSFGV